MGATMDAVGIARAKVLDDDSVSRAFEQEVLVAVAEDPAAVTGTVGQRCEEPETRHQGPLDQAACDCVAASLRTIGTSFFFSGSSRSSVRPR